MSTEILALTDATHLGVGLKVFAELSRVLFCRLGLRLLSDFSDVLRQCQEIHDMSCLATDRLKQCLFVMTSAIKRALFWSTQLLTGLPLLASKEVLHYGGSSVKLINEGNGAASSGTPIFQVLALGRAL